MRYAVISLAVASSILLIPGACAPAPAEVLTEQSAANLWARKALARKVQKLDLDRAPLEDAIEWVRDQAGLSCIINWKALQLQGVERETEVTVHLKDVTLARALETILLDAGGTEPLEYMIDDGVLLISSRDDLCRRVVTRLYPVSDLVSQTHPAFMDQAGAPWKGDLASGPDDSDGEREPAADEFVEMIRGVIDPPVWQSPEVSIRWWGTTLVVTQTPVHHRQIAKLLEALRAHKAAREVHVGLAAVRPEKAESPEALKKIVSKGGDVAGALEDGQEKGLWAMDRCNVDAVEIGCALAARQLTKYLEREKDAESPEEVEGIFGPGLPATEQPHAHLGYHVGVLPIERRAGKIVISLAAVSAWLDEGDESDEAEGDVSVGATSRHNVFDLALAPGEARRIPIIPAAARDGAVEIIVWLPKAAK